MVAGIFVNQPIYAHLDLSLSGAIPERIDPFAIVQRFLDAHGLMYPTDYSLATASALK